MTLVGRFVSNQSGNNAVEYAIIIGVVAAALTSVINGVGLALTAKLASVAGLTLGAEILPPFP